MLGQPPERPWYQDDTDLQTALDKVRNRIRTNAERYVKRGNNKINRRTIFKIGDWVVVKRLRTTDKDKRVCAKLLYPYEGPYIIQRVLNENTYQLKTVTGDSTRGKFHVELLYPYNPGETNIFCECHNCQI